MARGLSSYLMNNQALDEQSQTGLSPLDLYMAGQASQVVPNEVAEPIQAAIPAAPPAALSEIANNIPMATPEVNPLRGGFQAPSGYEKLAMEAALQQKQGIGALDNYIKEYAQTPTQIDFTPLAAWADTLAPGGKTLEAAKLMKPLTQDAKDQKLLALQGELQKRRGDYAKSMLDILQSKQKSSEANKNERFLQGQETRMFNQVRKEQAGLVKEASDFKNSYRNVENAITPDKDGTVSVARIHQSLSQFARLMGEKGVLTDSDTGRQLAPTLELMLARYQSILSSNPNARVPAKNIEAMREALSAAQQAFKETYTTKADIMRDTYLDPSSPYSSYEWAPKAIEQVYSPIKDIGVPRAPGMTEKQKRLQELRKKAGK